MSYITKNLLPGEKVVFQTRLHWIVFVSSMISLAIGLVIAVFGGAAVTMLLDVVPERPTELASFEAAVRSNAGLGGLVIGGLWALLALLRVIPTLFRVLSSEFSVTNKRVVMKLGILNRSVSDLLLDKIETINVEQSWRGRLLGYGTVVLTGTGASHEPFTDIAAPFELGRQVQTQLDLLRGT